MLTLTYGEVSVGEPLLCDPLTGKRYRLDEVDLPEVLRDFLAAMLEAPREGDRAFQE